jgi:hypothetical protein
MAKCPLADAPGSACETLPPHHRLPAYLANVYKLLPTTKTRSPHNKPHLLPLRPLSKRTRVTPLAKRFKHEGRESHDASPAPNSDIDCLSDFSRDGDRIELEEVPMHAPQVEEDIELYYSI